MIVGSLSSLSSVSPQKRGTLPRIEEEEDTEGLSVVFGVSPFDEDRVFLLSE